MIAWKYIDKNAATIAALRDYDNMMSITNNTPNEIKEIYESMATPTTANMSGMPSSRNPFSGQNNLVNQIDKLDIFRDRYVTAKNYFKWFAPAWSSLTDVDRRILREFYMGGNLKSGATYRLMHELSYSERKIEQMRSHALKQLKILLFG